MEGLYVLPGFQISLRNMKNVNFLFGNWNKSGILGKLLLDYNSEHHDLADSVTCGFVNVTFIMNQFLLESI